MKHKFSKQITSILLALVMIISMIPVSALTAFAADEMRSEVKWGDKGRIQFTLNDSGVLTWSVVPGATSYDLNIYMHGSLFKSEEGNTSRSYNLVTELNKYKKDSGAVQIIINPKGVEAGSGDKVSFMYSSPYPKLEAPSNLKWDVYGNADWDDVANADGYTLYLYQPSSGAYNHYDLAGSYFNCTNYPDVATRISDGWYFAVRATSTGAFRPSEYNESYRRGHVIGSGLTAGTTWGNSGNVKFTVTNEGVLTWTEISGATAYDLNMWMSDGLFRSVTGLTTCEYALQAELNKAKKDSGTVKIALNPVGNNVADKADGVYLLYSSPYGKLEAPTHLTWNGNIGSWGYVPGAESYTVYLYQSSGGAYNHWITTETQFDFSTVASVGEDWFFTVKATAENARDSAYNESPRYTGPESTTLYTIGAYAYDATNETMDAGGQVYMETNAGLMDWTSSGTTCLAIEGTAVRLNASPAPGYVFVEWRQGTKGTTISRETKYSFTATNDKFLYAIFREKGANEIAEVVGKIAEEHIPYAGTEVMPFMPSIPDGEPYSRIWNGTEWRDENGILISANIGHHYDLGYEFEAGKSYTTDDFYFDAVDGYTFAEDVKVHLEGPDPSMWDYEITGFNDSRTMMYVKFTFHIPGNRDYPDINKVSLVYSGTVADGYTKPNPSYQIYNNCAITREEWNAGTWGSSCNWDTSGDEMKFKAGNTYVHMIELTALPGYKFSEDLLVQKGRQVEEEYGVVSLSDDRTVATVTYTYNVSDYILINTVNLLAKPGDEDFYLIRGGHNMASGTAFYAGDDRPYEVLNRFQWYNADTGEEVNDIITADVKLGEKYSLVFRVDIKDEYYTTYRYAENLTVVLGGGYQYARADFVEVSTRSGNAFLEVTITYTVQPKVGEGDRVNYPVVCNSFSEFKYAMENENIRYVALGNINETLPVGKEGLVTAIQVKGIKNLQLLGDATFTAPAMTQTTYAALLHTTQYTTLNISGAGSLTFKAVANSSYNAVIYNQGGSVNIYEGTLIGSYNTAVYGKAIWQEYGDLRISGGQLFAENALAPGNLPNSHSAVYINGGQAWIEGGTFRTRNWIDTIDLPYGLEIGQYATVDLSGGTFHGILLPTSSTRLANYMDEETYTPFSDGSRFNPESEYSQGYVESGKVVRIVWLIDHVDVHINAPIAGVEITENYFNVPTSGCQAAMYYPMWYKNGEPVTYGTFEAGASYKVVVRVEPKPGYGIEFASGITAALNNRNASLKSHGAHYVEFEYDFGECPNIVPEVDLTATAPKEGQKPSYTIGLGSNAYKLVGNYNNYKDYRQWYMSSDGDEWWPINENHTFMSGYYYKLYVDIQTASGYEFPLIDNGTIQPNVSATVNGYYATVYKAYDQDPSNYITVEYNFGECNDSVVENIVVENVVEPVAGQKPVYTYAIRGSGYRMNTAKNAYYDVYWKNPPEKWYYIKNGIGWWDVTEEDWVYEHEIFVAGHQYQVVLYLEVEEGYEFAHSKYYEPTVTATVNGQEAEATTGGSDCIWYQKVEYTFLECEPGPETGVDLSGTVTSFHNAAGEITLQLIPQGSGVTYETAVMGNTVHYSFSGIAAGSYTLKVMKKDHVTREYSITVGNTALVQDVKICLRGDVNGDGRVNVADTSKVYAQAKGNGGLTDYAFACGDVTGDGKINVADTSKIYAHAKMTSLLW